MECPSCGHEAGDDALFCPHCGASLEEKAMGQGYSPEPQGIPVPPPGTVPSPPSPVSGTYPAPPWGTTLPGALPYPSPAARTEGLCVAALVLGLVSLVLFWVPVLAWVLGLLGIVFGALGMRSVRDNPGYKTGYGMGLAGLVMGAVGLVGGVVIFIVAVSSLP